MKSLDNSNIHPYQDIPAFRHWKKSVSSVEASSVDPVVSFDFRITKSDKVATAGSCFAQHIARYLSKSGFNYYISETGHPLLSAERKKQFNYDMFSARYGNIYTSRQLVQLIDRAYGDFTPVDDAWENAEGRWFDPYRPNIQPNGFESKQELLLDREAHLRNVRDMFESLDVFVFTLGLTEVWINAEDGAAYPICPGVSSGSFNEKKHLFMNISVDQVVEDMGYFFNKLASINEKARVILTVSPVPLMATAESRHVIQSNTLSKSVLRVAADTLEHKFSQVSYFPSYEIITANYSRGAYFADDLRSVLEDGVKQVMTLFMHHVTLDSASDTDLQAAPVKSNNDALTKSSEFEKHMQEVVEVICDEDFYE